MQVGKGVRKGGEAYIKGEPKRNRRKTRKKSLQKGSMGGKEEQVEVAFIQLVKKR